MDKELASEISKSQEAKEQESTTKTPSALLEAHGLGVEMAKVIDVDEYIRQLRDGWDDREEQLER